MERSIIRVGIVEAHAVMRAGIRSVLEAAGDIEVAGEASDGDGALHLVRTESPAVLTLGLVMQGVSGTDLIRETRRAGQLPRIVVLTRSSKASVASQCFAAGASGFVVKTCPAHELLAAVRKVASGGVYVNLTASDEPMLDVVASDSGLPHERLTPYGTSYIPTHRMRSDSRRHRDHYGHKRENRKHSSHKYHKENGAQVRCRSGPLRDHP
ncbi:response regulator transcription factor [Paraburkholderia sp. UYCP14C]|nr:response regulator transcription factor [Paraburkholderia sp. UYCP14C]